MAAHNDVIMLVLQGSFFYYHFIQVNNKNYALNCSQGN